MDDLIVESVSVQDSMTEGIFHTPRPSARAATRVAGVGVGATAEATTEDTAHFVGKKYGVAKVEKDSGMCLSKIGAGGTLCLRKNCEVGSHVEAEKFVVTEHGSILVLKNTNVAFCEPTVDSGQLTEDVWAEWQDVGLPLGIWSDRFLAVDNRTSDTSPMTKAVLELGMEEFHVAKTFKTPGKRVKNMLGGNMAVFSPYQAKILEEHRADFINDSTEAGAATLIVDLDSEMARLARLVVELGLETKSEFIALEDSMRHVSNKTQILVKQLGKCPTGLSGAYEAPTLWGSLGLISDMISDCPTKSQVEAEVTKVHSDGKTMTKTLETKTVTLAKNLLNRIEKTESELAILKNIRVSTTSGFGTNFAPASEEEVEEIRSTLERMEGEFGRFKAENEVTSVKFGGLGLRGFDECEAWIAKNFPDRAYGTVVDVYALFDRIVDDGSSNMAEMLASMEKRMKLKIDTAAEAQAIAAFLNEVPRIFHSPEATEVHIDSHVSMLSKLPSIDHWSKGQHCLKNVIVKKLNKIKTSIKRDMERRLPLNSVALQVAIEGLEKSCSWILNLIKFMDGSFESLHQTSKFSKKQAWSLVTQLIRRIFYDLHAVRVGVLDSMTTDKESICAAVLWGVFQTQDVMEDYEKHNFENHPSMASEYVKFLATNSGFEVMEDLEATVTRLDKENGELKRALTEAKRKADVANSAADRAEKAVNDLAKRVAAMEKKK